MQGPHWTPAQRLARLDKLVERNRAEHKGAFLYENAGWMRDAYEVRGLSLRALAGEAGCSVRTIARWMAIHSIPTRAGARPPARRGEDHPAWKGARVCPSCGGPRAHGARTCNACRDRTGVANARWKGEDVGYTAAHARVVAAKGLPSNHPCQHCGGAASEWAYDRLDPDERRNRTARDDGPYSLDPSHYLPLCVRCHRRFDLGRPS